MEINGTTQSVLKITVYSSDGTVISDPYIRINRTPLICWIWSWQWWWFALVPIWYGYDVFAYTHFTYLEENIWFNSVITEPLTNSLLASVASGIVAGVLIFNLPIPEPFHKLASAMTIIIGFAVAGEIGRVHGDLINKIFLARQQNVSVDPVWGFRFYEYVHYPVSPPTGAPWYYPPVPDVLPTIAWYYVTATGGIIGVTPPYYDLPLPIDPIQAYDLQYLYSTIANEYGWDTWIWIGGIPGGTPPT